MNPVSPIRTAKPMTYRAPADNAAAASNAPAPAAPTPRAPKVAASAQAKPTTHVVGAAIGAGVAATAATAIAFGVALIAGATLGLPVYGGIAIIGAAIGGTVGTLIPFDPKFDGR
jgi:hypothetical protein